MGVRGTLAGDAEEEEGGEGENGATALRGARGTLGARAPRAGTAPVLVACAARSQRARGPESRRARAVTLACGRAGVRAGGQGETVGRRARWICAAGAVGALIGAALGAIVGWTVALSDTRVRACTLRPTGLAATARER